MTAHVHRYVAVEYRGGPKDGDRDVLPWPPLPEVYFPRYIPLTMLAAPAPLLGDVPCSCHRYAATDTQHCQPFEVSEAELVAARDTRLILDCLAERRAPFVYTWQGAV